MTSADSSTSNSPRTSISSFSLGNIPSGNAAMAEPSAKRSITQRFSPTIPVLASPTANEYCSQFGAESFADFLLPFGMSVDSRVTVRDSQGLSQSLEGFTLRFCSSDDINYSQDTPALLDSIESSTKHLLKQKVWQDEMETLKEIATTGSVGELRNEESTSITPWYGDYCKALLRPIHIVDYETFDHPLACVLVVHYTDDYVTEVLSDLYSQFEKLVLEFEFMDPNILKYYILLGDESSSDTKQRTADQLAIMKKTFGLNCHMLILDGPSPSGLQMEFRRHTTAPIYTHDDIVNSTIPSDEYVDFRPEEYHFDMLPFQYIDFTNLPADNTLVDPPLQNEEVCSVKQLTHANIERIHTVIREMTVQCIIPFMERMVNHLNDQVASQRRGLTGRLFSVGRRYLNQRSPNLSQTTLQSPLGASGSYSHNSAEGQMRKLADCAFMLQDYRLAYTIYDTLRRDFGSERAQVHQAAALCMQALTNALNTGSSRSDGVHFQTQGADLFARNGHRYACVRSTILFTNALRFRGLHELYPSSIMQMISNKYPLQSAFFVEQNAFSYLKQGQTSLRKFALMQAFAGHFYETAGQAELAELCSLFSTRFTQGGWSRISAYLCMERTKLAWRKGLPSIAVQTVCDMLAEKNLEDEDKSRLLTALHQLSMSPNLGITSVTLKAPLLLVSPFNIGDKRQKVEYDASWSALEDSFLAVDFAHNGRKAPNLLHKSANLPIFGIHDDLKISFDVYNPFDQMITLDDVTLQYVHSESKEETSEGGYQVTLQRHQSLRLEAFSSEMITINVKVQSPGVLAITGLFYNLNGSLNCLESPIDSAQLSLEIQAPAPALKMKLVSDHFDHLRSGQILHADLDIENCGQIGLRDLRVMTDSPTFVRIHGSCNSNIAMDAGVLFVENPIMEILKSPESVLDAQSSTSVRLSIHGDKIGDHLLRFLFVYQSQADANSSRFLTSHFEIPLKVIPSLKINAFTRAKHSAGEHYLLGLDIENLFIGQSIQICDIVARSPTWALVSNEQPFAASQILPQLDPGRSAFAYYEATLVQEQPNSPSIDHLTSDRMMSFLTGQKPSDDSALTAAVLHDSSMNATEMDEDLLWFMRFSKQSFVKQNLTSNFEMIAERHWQDIFTAHQSGDFDLAVIWKTDSYTGTHFVFGIRLGASSPFEHLDMSKLGQTKTMYSESDRERFVLFDAIKKSLSPKREGSLQVHVTDKSTQKLSSPHPAIKTSKIQLENGIKVAGVKYRLSVGSGAQSSRVTTDGLRWLGKTSRTGVLASQENTSGIFQSTVMKTGIYDINKWQVSCSSSDDLLALSKESTRIQLPPNSQFVNIE